MRGLSFAFFHFCSLLVFSVDAALTRWARLR